MQVRQILRPSGSLFRLHQVIETQEIGRRSTEFCNDALLPQRRKLRAAEEAYQQVNSNRSHTQLQMPLRVCQIYNRVTRSAPPKNDWMALSTRPALVGFASIRTSRSFVARGLA